MIVRAARKQFTVEQYYRMAETGILTPADRVELIEGEVVQMSPIGPRHASCVGRLTGLFVTTLGPQAIVFPQNPVRLNDYSEPQPDLAILKPRSDYYAEAHPQPADVLALIEVSDSTVKSDRTTKALLYARVGIRELWIVDLNALAIEVLRSPSPEGYQDVQTLKPGQSLVFQALPETTFKVEQILAGFL